MLRYINMERGVGSMPAIHRNRAAVYRMKLPLRRLRPKMTAEEEDLIKEFGTGWRYAGPYPLPLRCGMQCKRPHHYYCEIEAWVCKYLKEAWIHDRMVASANTWKIYMQRLQELSKSEKFVRDPYFEAAWVEEFESTSCQHRRIMSAVSGRKRSMESCEEMIVSLNRRIANAIVNWDNYVKRILEMDTHVPQGLVSRLRDLSLESSPGCPAASSSSLEADCRSQGTSQDMKSVNVDNISLLVSPSDSPDGIRQTIRRLRSSSAKEEELIGEYGEEWWHSPALYVPALIGRQYESSRYDPYQKEATARKYLKEARKQEKMLAAVYNQVTYVRELSRLRQIFRAREGCMPHIEEVVADEYYTEYFKYCDMFGLVRAQGYGLELFAGVAQCLYGSISMEDAEKHTASSSSSFVEEK